MNLYFELLGHPVFDREDVAALCHNAHTAQSALPRLIRDGLVVRIRNNMYTCISGQTMQPIASRYQIGCAVSKSAYISHHSAMELYGKADQVFYEVDVSSESRLNDFEFDGWHYRYIRSRCSLGVEQPALGGGIRVTDRERTVIDCIRDMDKIAGPEEVLSCISAMGRLSESRLLTYLEQYHNQFLYQKTGLILWHWREHLGLSDSFFAACQLRIGKSKRYFSRDVSSGHFDRRWQIVVPEHLFEMKNGVSEKEFPGSGV